MPCPAKIPVPFDSASSDRRYLVARFHRRHGLGRNVNRKHITLKQSAPNASVARTDCSNYKITNYSIPTSTVLSSFP
jgi:hypothetical protein